MIGDAEIMLRLGRGRSSLCKCGGWRYAANTNAIVVRVFTGRL
jgi:hypothetical protein